MSISTHPPFKSLHTISLKLQQHLKCVWVWLKHIHHKNLSQHSADLKMLEKVQQLEPVFLNLETGTPKKVGCVRVDGAADEDPGHEEVQFYWTERHIDQAKVVTLVTTRSSGSSYLNRMELQNGCLSLGHANTSRGEWVFEKR